MTDDQRTDVLVAALNERYEALRVIRERVQNIGLWALGLMLGAGGWLISSDATFDCLEKIVGIAGVVGAVSVLRLLYLGDLRRGFQSQQKVAARIEAILGFYKPGEFDPGSMDSLYPAGWGVAGKPGAPGRFFTSTYVLLYVGAVFLIAAIAFAS